MFFEYMSAQPPGVGVAHMVDPALNAGIQFSERNLPGPVSVQIMFQPAGEVDALRRLSRRCVGYTTNPSQGMPQPVGKTWLAASWSRQPLRCHARDDGLLPSVEPRFAVAEQREIIHVAQICTAAKLALDKPVEVVQINI